MTAKNIDGLGGSNVKLRMQLPAELTYDHDDGGCTYAAPWVTCALGTLAKNASNSVAVTVLPTAAGTYHPGANVQDDEGFLSGATFTLVVDDPAKASPTIAGSISGDGRIDDPQQLTATLAGGDNPTGTITFKGYPNDGFCSFTGPTLTATVNGNGQYSATLNTSTPGTYHWIASYSGDAANNPVTTNCADMTQFLAARPTVSLLGAGNTTATSATATLSYGYFPSGTLTFRAYADATCTTPVATATVLANGNGNYTGYYTLPGPGTYTVTVAYSGDAGNVGVTPSGCTGGNQITVKAADTQNPPDDSQSPPGDSNTATAPPATHQPPPAAPVTPKPDNHFTLGHAKLSAARTITLPLTAPGAGRFSAIAKSGTTTYGTAAATQPAKGMLKLTVKPSSAGRKLLKKHAKLKLTVKVTFTPAGGTAYTRTITVTVKRS
jgi:hypothetical protein